MSERTHIGIESHKTHTWFHKKTWIKKPQMQLEDSCVSAEILKLKKGKTEEVCSSVQDLEPHPHE